MDKTKGQFLKVFLLILTVIGVALLTYVIFFLRGLLLMIFIAFLIALTVSQSIRNLHRQTRWPLMLCGSLIYLLVLVAIIGIIVAIVPTLAVEIVAMANNFSLWQYIPHLNELTTSLSEATQLVNMLTNWSGAVAVFTGASFRGLFYLAATVMISFYLSLGRGRVIKVLRRFGAPPATMTWLTEFLLKLEKNLGGWLRARAILTSFMIGIIFLLLSIFAVPYALALAILAGIFDVVVVIGPFLTALPAVLLAWNAHGLSNAIMIAIFYAIANQVKWLFVAPRLFQTGNNISPAVSIVGIIGGYILFGVVGAILAIPIIIVGQTLLTSLPLKSRNFGAKVSKRLLGQG